MDGLWAPSQTLHEEHVEFVEDAESVRRLADSVGMVPVNELRERLCEAYEAMTRRVIPHAMAEDHSPLAQVTGNHAPNGPRRDALAREHLEIAQLLDELDGLRWDLAHPALTPGQEQAARRVLYGLYALLRVHLVGQRRCMCEGAVRPAPSSPAASLGP